MKKILFLAFCLVLAMSVSSMAFTWNYYDFGSMYFDQHNNTSDIDFGWHNGNYIGMTPSPGQESDGGEKFDIEGANYMMDADYIYFSNTASFGDAAYSTVFDDYYSRGHFFFGFDGSKYMYAIDENGDLIAVDTWSVIPDEPGTYGGNLNIVNQAGAYRVATGTVLGSVDMMMTEIEDFEPNPMYAGQTDTWITEYRISKSLFANLDYTTISVHMTMECGNDLIEKDFNVVPEPATLFLLGLGMAGIGIIRRKKN